MHHCTEIVAPVFVRHCYNIYVFIVEFVTKVLSARSFSRRWFISKSPEGNEIVGISSCFVNHPFPRFCTKKGLQYSNNIRSW
jgi:hypothetical protein